MKLVLASAVVTVSGAAWPGPREGVNPKEAVAVASASARALDILKSVIVPGYLGSPPQAIPPCPRGRAVGATLIQKRASSAGRPSSATRRSAGRPTSAPRRARVGRPSWGPIPLLTGARATQTCAPTSLSFATATGESTGSAPALTGRRIAPNPRIVRNFELLRRCHLRSRHSARV